MYTISPDPQEKLASYVKKENLDLVMLSDPELEVTASYGIVNPKQNIVPHPTALVIDTEGIVSYIRVDEKYSKRPSAEELLRAIDAP